MSESPPTSTPRLPDYTLIVPALGGRLRLAALAYGGLLLVWSSLEDNSVLPVSALGWGLAVIALTLWITRHYGGRRIAGRAALLATALAGAAAGLGATLAGTLLMLVKTGLHSHVFPDYPFGLMVDILARAPLWALAGMLAAVGLLLVWWAAKSKKH